MVITSGSIRAFGKSVAYLRNPLRLLLIFAPGARGNGTASQEIVEFVDLYPTSVAELCGLTPPQEIEGKSIVPLLKASPPPPPPPPRMSWRGEAFTQALRPGDGLPVMGASIRTDRWRYTEWNEGQQGLELYDHAQDPGVYEPGQRFRL